MNAIRHPAPLKRGLRVDHNRRSNPTHQPLRHPEETGVGLLGGTLAIVTVLLLAVVGLWIWSGSAEPVPLDGWATLQAPVALDGWAAVSAPVVALDGWVNTAASPGLDGWIVPSAGASTAPLLDGWLR